MTFLEHRIPPPIVALVCAAAMWLVASRAAPVSVDRDVRVLAAVLVGAIGFAVMLAGVISFRRARTTINPLKPGEATALVTSGVFRYTRNPMYLGMLLVLVGWTAFLASPVALVGVAAFWAYIDRFQIRPEEAALAALFGQAYADYTARVRRWI